MYDKEMMQAAYMREKVQAMVRYCRQLEAPGTLRYVLHDGANVRDIPIKLDYNYPIPIKNRVHWNLGIAWEHPFDLLKGARYITHLSVTLNGAELRLRVVCGPKDEPRRWMGRMIALMRLAGWVESQGCAVLAIWGKGEQVAPLRIPACVEIPDFWLPAEFVERLNRERRAREALNKDRNAA